MPIWGQTHCFRRHADLVTDTILAHKNKAAASCRTPSASRLPTPSASAEAPGYHNQGQKAFSFQRKRGSLAAMGCAAHRAMLCPRPLESRL